jgi:MoaA/NifB/PqqE/SkfB family radical SAM enzyme
MPSLSSISNFMVTSRCNGRCTTCNIWKTTPAPDPPLEKIEGFFEENSELLKNLEFIQLTGGEPFLRDDLPSIAEAVHNVAPKCMIWLPTNGLLPEKIEKTTQRILDSYDEPKVGVTVSLDGEGVMHDIQRGIDGSYKKAIETLNRLYKLKPLGLHISTGFTLTSNNYKHAPIIQKISYQHGVDFSLRPINISEHYYQNMDQKGEFQQDEITESLDAIGYTVNKEKGTLSCLTNLAYLQGAKEFISDKRTMSCSAATESVFIDAYGDVYPCIVMNHKLGNIYQNPLGDVLKSPSSWEAREIIKKLECPTCWLECEAYRDIKKDWMRLFNALIWGIKLSV